MGTGSLFVYDLRRFLWKGAPSTKENCICGSVKSYCLIYIDKCRLIKVELIKYMIIIHTIDIRNAGVEFVVPTESAIGDYSVHLR